MTISEKVAYLKGMADGMELEKETSKEAKLLVKVLDVLEELGLSVEDLDDELEAVSDELDALSDDLSDVETMVFEDLDDDDEDDDDDEENNLLYDLGDDFFEIECPGCGEDLIVDESVPLAALVLSCVFAWIPALKAVSPGIAIVVCTVAAAALGQRPSFS